MLNNSTPSATAIGPPLRQCPTHRPWSSPISLWCVKRGRPTTPRPGGRTGTAISRGKIGAAVGRNRWRRWSGGSPNDTQRRLREERVDLAFGLRGAAWNEELALERYELLYEAGLVGEAARDAGRAAPADKAAGVMMAVVHRRILATAIGRLRAKIKYRPVVFELMPPSFTLLQLQRTVEALSGVRLHKQNFRRLVEQQGLVEETGEVSAQTGGRPARLVRCRREVVLERPAPGLRLRVGRRGAIS